MDTATEAIKNYDTIAGFFDNHPLNAILFVVIIAIIKLIDRRIKKFVEAIKKESDRSKEVADALERKLDIHILNYTDFKARTEENRNKK